jgi:hypothetical protein
MESTISTAQTHNTHEDTQHRSHTRCVPKPLTRAAWYSRCDKVGRGVLGRVLADSGSKITAGARFVETASEVKHERRAAGSADHWRVVWQQHIIIRAVVRHDRLAWNSIPDSKVSGLRDVPRGRNACSVWYSHCFGENGRDTQPIPANATAVLRAPPMAASEE